MTPRRNVGCRWLGPNASERAIWIRRYNRSDPPDRYNAARVKALGTS